jgi:hypothetical protein
VLIASMVALGTTIVRTTEWGGKALHWLRERFEAGLVTDIRPPDCTMAARRQGRSLSALRRICLVLALCRPKQTPGSRDSHSWPGVCDTGARSATGRDHRARGDGSQEVGSHAPRAREGAHTPHNVHRSRRSAFSRHTRATSWWRSVGTAMTAASTPSSLFSLFSIRAAQAAQVMPSRPSWMRVGAWGAAGVTPPRSPLPRSPRAARRRKGFALRRSRPWNRDPLLLHRRPRPPKAHARRPPCSGRNACPARSR